MIFILSVHQRNALLGTGYPLPITFTQNVSSRRGIVVSTLIGILIDAAASFIFFKTPYTYACITGFSTSVSLQTTCTSLFRSSKGTSEIASQTSCKRAVESFPPLNPIIQGRRLSSIKYWSLSSEII